MSADKFLLKVADVLEQLGAQIDANEAEKVAAVRKAREETAKSLSTKISELTGEELPADVVEKLAAADEKVISTVTRLVEKSAHVESMGGASDELVDRQPTTKKEALDAAYNRFGTFINS
jgi:hypothetical protein